MLAEVTVGIGDLIAAGSFALAAGIASVSAYRRHDANTVRRAMHEAQLGERLGKIDTLEQAIHGYAESDAAMHEELRQEFRELQDSLTRLGSEVRQQLEAGDERMGRIETEVHETKQLTANHTSRLDDHARRLRRIEVLLQRRAARRADDPPDADFLRDEDIDEDDLG